jgi:hypothetical protein
MRMEHRRLTGDWVKSMKKSLFLLLLIGLLTTETFLGAAFLPMSWQLAVQRVLPKSHDHSYITHPNIEGEIDQALRHHASVAAIFYAVLVLLLAGNTFLLTLIWRKLSNASQCWAVHGPLRD